MIIYSSEKHFKAHSAEHPKDYYDNTRRMVCCLGCGEILGTQILFDHCKKRGFKYEEDSKMDNWKHCPYCGESLVEKKKD